MSPKVSRNDPCPCGSGKKYKKCCELKESKKFEATVLKSGAEAAKTQKLFGRVSQMSSEKPEPLTGKLSKNKPS